MTSHISRNQQALDSCRDKYQIDYEDLTIEIKHLKIELEQEKAIHSSLNFKQKKRATISTSTSNLHESEKDEKEILESNFLKLKDLYDTLYKSNLSLMKDHKDLEGKYSR